jgi:hypothetical protein
VLSDPSFVPPESSDSARRLRPGPARRFCAGDNESPSTGAPRLLGVLPAVLLRFSEIVTASFVSRASVSGCLWPLVRRCGIVGDVKNSLSCSSSESCPTVAAVFFLLVLLVPAGGRCFCVPFVVLFLPWLGPVCADGAVGVSASVHPRLFSAHT